MVKIITAIIGAIVAAIVWMFSTFESVTAAELKWSQHNQAIACRTVYELEKEVQRYMERLRFDRSLTEGDRAWIREQVAQIQRKITRLDPKGVC